MYSALMLIFCKQEILVGIDEKGVEVARRYTSVARDESNDSQTLNTNSRPVSPHKQTGEVGGTESPPINENKLKPAIKMQISSK